MLSKLDLNLLERLEFSVKLIFYQRKNKSIKIYFMFFFFSPNNH